jgi:hypothetical protein
MPEEIISYRESRSFVGLTAKLPGTVPAQRRPRSA